MSIDPKDLEAGGTVRLTMRDGAKVEGVLQDSVISARLWTASGRVMVIDDDGRTLSTHIRSIDAYEPPIPAHLVDAEVIRDKDGWLWELTEAGTWWHPRSAWMTLKELIEDRGPLVGYERIEGDA